jgi:very-short-patch-repair endonuclease
MICHAIKGFTEFRQQYPVEPYKVDIYLPNIDMAVECDERGHTRYSPLEEIVREQFIIQRLACSFERYDPAHPDQVGNIINKIFKAILKRAHVDTHD